MALDHYSLYGATIAYQGSESVQYTSKKDREQGQAQVIGDVVYIEGQDFGVKTGHKGSALVTNDKVRFKVENQNKDFDEGAFVYYDPSNDKYTLTHAANLYKVGVLLRPYKNGETKIIFNVVQTLDGKTKAQK